MIIAELGINHNASLDKLKQLADSAINNGADCVKLQIKTPELCVPKEEWDRPKQWFDGSWTTYIDYKRRMEFNEEQLEDFNLFMKDNYGPLRWFASAWDLPSLDKLLQFDVPYVKLASASITDLELVDAVADCGVPVIFSTGMSVIEQIYDVMRLLANRAPQVMIMHCHSAYPAPDNEANLSAIDTLRKHFPFCRIGFSSHHVSPLVPIHAISGYHAQLIEVHFTLDRAWPGTDQVASLEPKGLAYVRREWDRIKVIRGDGQIKVFDSEVPAMTKLRKK